MIREETLMADIDEILMSAEERMEKAITALKENFMGVRTGRANAMVLDRIKVDYYGVPTPVNQMAGVKTPEAHLLVIEPWDKGMLRAIEHAILESDLGVTPNNDGSVIRLPFPSLTEERRRDLVKQCKTYAEEARVAVRNARRDANTAIEKAVKNDNLPEDESKRAEAEIQKMTDRFVAEVDEVLKKKEAEVMEQSLDADIRKKAEADKFARQQQADAELYKRQRNAEADKFEKQQEAEAKKAQAEAELFAKQQEAAGIRAVGEAEAKAIEAKGLAEAEALEKKAEAMKKYGQAAMVEMIVKALPEMAKAIAEPLSTIDKVTIIDGNGEGSGVGSMGSYVPQVLAKTMESVKEVTGIDIADIMRANTYDAKVNKNVNITGLDGIKVEAPAEAGTSVDTTVE